MQRTGAFRLRLEKALNRLLRVTISSSVAAQWLSIRLQLLGAFIATSIALLSVLGSATDLLHVSPALLGISLVYSLSIVSKLNGLVGSLTETEQEMVSVERCSEYLSLPCEFLSPVGGGADSAALLSSAGPAASVRGAEGSEDNITTPLLSSPALGDAPDSTAVISAPPLPLPLPSSWPARGEIVFRDVRMRYSPSSPDALCGVSLTIPPGARVAVVGRTGSGKSSLLRVLLGVSPYHAGSVAIDGVELRDVPRDVLRARLSIIPQDPLLLSGPLRLSLDPWRRHGDEALARALVDCGFVDTMVSSGEEGAKEQRARELLDFAVVEGGASLSLGQRQLLCLGRALLRGSRVVLLDEFSSSVDAQAEALLYSLLEKSIARTGSTLLVISHRSPPASCTLQVSMSQGVANLISIK
jgi:ABC-type multidrug transport system fused ATPase/permease subunit